MWDWHRASFVNSYELYFFSENHDNENPGAKIETTNDKNLNEIGIQTEEKESKVEAEFKADHNEKRRSNLEDKVINEKEFDFGVKDTEEKKG